MRSKSMGSMKWALISRSGIHEPVCRNRPVLSCFVPTDPAQIVFWLLAAGFLVACRDRKNVLEPICALISVVNTSSTQECSWIYPETFGCEKGARDGWGIYVLVRIRGPRCFADLAPVAPDFSGALRVLTRGFEGTRILAAH